MSRMRVLYEINCHLETCKGCPIRQEMVRTMKGLFAKQDAYCNRQCPVGERLQQLGQQLKRSESA